MGQSDHLLPNVEMNQIANLFLEAVFLIAAILSRGVRMHHCKVYWTIVFLRQAVRP